MNGVIVCYPGTGEKQIEDLLADHGIEITYDGFGINSIPSDGVNRRLYSYSARTILLINDPVHIMSTLYSVYGKETSTEAFVSSMTMGASRLNMFMSIWIEIVQQRQFTVMDVTKLNSSVLSDVFKTKIDKINPIYTGRNTLSDVANRIVNNTCRDSYETLARLT